MDKVNKAVVMARKHRLDEIAKLIQDQAYRIEALEARIAKADALAEALAEAIEDMRYLIPNQAGAALTDQAVEEEVADLVSALAAYREGSDT